MIPAAHDVLDAEAKVKQNPGVRDFLLRADHDIRLVAGEKSRLQAVARRIDIPKEHISLDTHQAVDGYCLPSQFRLTLQAAPINPGGLLDLTVEVTAQLTPVRETRRQRQAITLTGRELPD